MRQIRAIRALHMNYSWRGVYIWLRGRKRPTGKRGWRMVLREPERVIERYEAIAEGNAL